MTAAKKIASRGQALVVLLVFIVISITITSAAVVIILVNSRATTRFEQGVTTVALADSGAENALLRLLRDPQYSGETLTIGPDSVTVNVSGTSTKTIRSGATAGKYLRDVEVTAIATPGGITVTSWKEVF